MTILLESVKSDVLGKIVNTSKTLAHDRLDELLEVRLKNIAQSIDYNVRYGHISSISPDEKIDYGRIIDEIKNEVSTKKLRADYYYFQEAFADKLSKLYALNKDELIEDFEKVLKDEFDNDNYVFRYDLPIKQIRSFDAIFSRYDFSKMTDADFKIFEPEDFKKKDKLKFSCALAINGDIIDGVVIYDDGKATYWYVTDKTNRREEDYQDQRRPARIFDTADYIVAISNEYLEKADKSFGERENRRRDRIDRDKIANITPETKRSKYKKELKDQKKQKFINNVKELLQSVKEETLEIMRNNAVDILDDESKISKYANEVITRYNEINKRINSWVYDLENDKSFLDSIYKLKQGYSMLKNEEEKLHNED